MLATLLLPFVLIGCFRSDDFLIPTADIVDPFDLRDKAVVTFRTAENQDGVESVAFEAIKIPGSDITAFVDLREGGHHYVFAPIRGGDGRFFIMAFSPELYGTLYLKRPNDGGVWYNLVHLSAQNEIRVCGEAAGYSDYSIATKTSDIFGAYFRAIPTFNISDCRLLGRMDIPPASKQTLAYSSPSAPEPLSCQTRIDQGMLRCEAVQRGECWPGGCPYVWRCDSVARTNRQNGTTSFSVKSRNVGSIGECSTRGLGSPNGWSSWFCDPTTGRHANDYASMVRKACR